MLRDPTPQEQASLTAGASMWRTVAVPEAGIPAVTMADGPMGIASGRVDERDVAILTPCATALGAGWDVALAARVGALVGIEAARRGIDLVLAPNINIARSPLAGRAFEYFSEDPLLTAIIGAAWIGGLQSTGTGAIAKHLVCNDSETMRDRMNVVVDERTLREIYLLPFEHAARAGCAGMLTSYNRVNGDWCAENRHVITEICKQEWQFTGVVMSDWFGTHTTLGSLHGGLDLEMPGPARHLGAKAADAVASAHVPQARVADAAARVSNAARRFAASKVTEIAKPEADALLIEAAAAGFTLLKNTNDLLPMLPGAIRTLAVIGPNAAMPCYQGGTFAKIAVTPDAVTPIDAIRKRYGQSCTILFEPGVDPQPRLPSMPARPARDLGDGCTRGLTIDYFTTPDCTGTPVDSETRDTNSLVWFVGVHDLGVFTAPASIRASGRYTARQDGQHLFYLGGTGRVSLRVDGTEILRRDEEVAAGDTMGKLKRGDADSAAFMLRRGQDILIDVEFRYQAARVQGLWYGLREPDSAGAMLARAVQAASQADAVVLIVGETSDSSVESKDREDTCLHAAQIGLIEAVTQANPRTAIVANVGHAFDTAWDRHAACLLVAWYPGQEFGHALAEVLAGDREPGGRLPVSIAAREADYPAFNLQPDAGGDLPYAEATRLGYRGLHANGTPPRHAFGAGFGYARFSLGAPALQGDRHAGVQVHLSVTNTSTRAGSEVVQIYRDAPELALIGFCKCHLAAGESRQVTVSLGADAFRIWDAGWRVIDRPLHILVGRSAVDLVSVVVP